jgi:urease accessory protein
MHIEAQHITIQQWMSPAFPIGAFAYSHGLEWAMETGRVSDGESLFTWLVDLLKHGSAKTDASFIVRAYQSEEYEVLNAQALALCPSQERITETTLQGNAFCKVLRDVWGGKIPDLALPVAIGVAAKSRGLDRHLTVAAYLHAFCSNLISAAVRLVPLGQTLGQKVLMDLTPVILCTTDHALAKQHADFWSNCFLSDVASMRHETQSPRIFKT